MTSRNPPFITEDEWREHRRLLADRSLEIKELRLAGVEVSDRDHGRGGLIVVLSTSSRMSSVWEEYGCYEVNTRHRGHTHYVREWRVATFDDAWARAKRWVLDDS